MSTRTVVDGAGAGKRQVTHHVDCDLHHDEHPADELLAFALDGAGYELDVCADHASWCRDQLAAMVGMARRARTAVPTLDTSRKSRRDPAAYDRTCPTCQARPGGRCTRPSGWETGEPHSARRHAPAPPGDRALPFGSRA